MKRRLSRTSAGQVSVIRQLNIIDCAYVAGILDGEGSIQIGRRPPRAGAQHPTFNVLISVVNTNHELLIWLQEQLGGVVTQAVDSGLGEKRKPKWTWSASHRQAKDVLNLIGPYVRIKRPQLELALAFFELVGRYGKKAPAVYRQQEMLWARLRSLSGRVYRVPRGAPFEHLVA